jgi:hypothetical protein
MLGKSIQRLIGPLLLLISAGFLIHQWHIALTEGRYWQKSRFLFPFFTFLGLAVLLFPMTSQECLERYGVEKPQIWSHFTSAQKALVILGVAAGVANQFLISGAI